MDARTPLIDSAIYQRGVFIHRYSAIEYSIAELVTRAFLHAEYRHLETPPFGPKKKRERLRALLKIPGPLTPYNETLSFYLDEVQQYEGHRNFFAHALMVPENDTTILLRMYDHKEGEYQVGELRLTLDEITTLANLIGDASRAFSILTSRICRDALIHEPN